MTIQIYKQLQEVNKYSHKKYIYILNVDIYIYIYILCPSVVPHLMKECQRVNFKVPFSLVIQNLLLFVIVRMILRVFY